MFAQDLQNGRFLSDAETAEIDAGKCGGRFPILSQQRAGNEKTREREDPDAPRQKGHGSIVRVFGRRTNRL